MRKFVGFAALSVLVACNQQPPVQAPGGAQTESSAEANVVQAPPVTAPAAVPDDFKPSPLRAPLPESFQLPFPYHRLNDNTKVAGEGKAGERRVLVEILDVAPDEAQRLLTESLQSKGFGTSGPEQVNNRTRLAFNRADGDAVVVSINPRLRKAKAPNATGTVHLVWSGI